MPEYKGSDSLPKTGVLTVGNRCIMREIEFKMEREGLLPSNYYYTIDPSLAMSGNFPFNQRLLAREGVVTAIRELERGFYVTVRFEDNN